MNLYQISHPIPFPSSEYGGVWIIAAENERQAAEIVAREGVYESDLVHYFSSSVPVEDLGYIISLEWTEEQLETATQNLISFIRPKLIGTALAGTEAGIVYSFVT